MPAVVEGLGSSVKLAPKLVTLSVSPRQRKCLSLVLAVTALVRVVKPAEASPLQASGERQNDS